jgi:hypothetical protein
MRKPIIATAAALLTVFSIWIVAGEKAALDEAPHRALIVVEGVHGTEGVGQFAAISVVDRPTIGKLESFFPNYRKLPSSDIAAGWKTGATVYFDFGNARTVRVTVAKNDDGKTWSVGNGDFNTRGDFNGFLKQLRSLPAPDAKP